MAFHLKQSEANGQFYMCAISPNGKQIWKTPETYKRRQGAVKALNALFKMVGDTQYMLGKKGPGALPYVDKTNLRNPRHH